MIINDNTYSDSLIFSWGESYDADGDTLTYEWVGTEGLAQIQIPESKSPGLTIAYADLYNMIDQSQISHWSEASEISGTWTIVAKDPEANIQAVNGPFIMTIRENVWDATDNYGQSVSGGVYFYQLHAGEFIETRKMLLIK